MLIESSVSCISEAGDISGLPSVSFRGTGDARTGVSRSSRRDMLSTALLMSSRNWASAADIGERAIGLQAPRDADPIFCAAASIAPPY